MHDHDATVLWRVLYGSQRGLIGVHSALRPSPSSRHLSRHRPQFFDYPRDARAATAWCLGNSEERLETYFCAHLLTDRRRVKANAAPVLALWADADGSPLPSDAPEPTAVVETSPGRAHLFWRLTRPISPARAEDLNRRLLVVVRADRSGWDLSQLLRPPGTRNQKYAAAPAVRLVELDQGVRYHPRELELALPAAEGPSAGRCARSLPRPPRLPRACCGVDLSRLSGRMRTIIHLGNADAGSPYGSRSEADFAVAIAMFGDGYDEREIWTVLADPANGISERYLEKTHHGDAYLALTIGKAREVALPRAALRGVARGAGRDRTEGVCKSS